MQILDIVFISYKESNADKNWLELKYRFPHAKRVHGVEGIDKAHIEAAQKSSTDFFFVVDGDNRIRSEFNFSVANLKLERDTLYVWRCLNPINQLVYGYGAVKLYNKSLLQETKGNFVDLATSISPKYKIINEIASETHFFNTPEEAWRGAFRECAKLTTQINGSEHSEDARKRLNQWRDVKNNHFNSIWILKGVEGGKVFAEEKKEQLFLLNDFKWLHEEFKRYE